MYITKTKVLISSTANLCLFFANAKSRFSHDDYLLQIPRQIQRC